MGAEQREYFPRMKLGIGCRSGTKIYGFQSPWDIDGKVPILVP